MSGFIWNLSPTQHQVLVQTKQIIENMQDQKLAMYARGFMDDTMYLRFLRARKFEMNPALDMIVAMLKFRTEFQGIGVDAVTANTCMNELVSGKTFIHGYDPEGRPILFMKGRLHDASKVDPMEGQRFAIFVMEYCRKLLRPPVETVTLIFDMSDVGRKNLDLRFVKYIIDTLQSFYPESLGKIFVLNPTWFVQGVWKLVKNMLDPVTANKVSFVDRRGLLLSVGENNLLSEYGGKDPFVYNYQSAWHQPQPSLAAGQPSY